MRQACIPAIIGSLLATVYNPNVIGDEYAKLVAQAELECVVSRRGQGREKGWELGGRGGLRGAELMVVANECGMRALHGGCWTGHGVGPDGLRFEPIRRRVHLRR